MADQTPNSTGLMPYIDTSTPIPTTACFHTLMASSSGNTVTAITPLELPTIIQKDTAEYLPLYRAIVTNNWRKAQEIVIKDKDALTTPLNFCGHTALHVAIERAENIQFFENLLKEIDPESLPSIINYQKLNPLHQAACTDNAMAAKMLVEKNPRLLFIMDELYLPVHGAILNSHRTTAIYLLDACKNHIELSQQDGYHNPFRGEMGSILLSDAITSGFLDVSSELITEYPELARIKSRNTAPLTVIARKWDSYYSGTQYNFFQRFIYSYVPTENDRLRHTNKIKDIENQETCDATFITKCGKSSLNSVIQKIYVKIWKSVLPYVPHIKHLHEEKLKHQETIMVLKRICEEVDKLNKENDIRDHYHGALNFAVTNDTPEVLEEIIQSFPHALMIFINDYTITQLAIRNRSEKVYNFLVRNLSNNKHFQQQGNDKDGFNTLHMAAQLAPIHKLNLVSGAALQMQRELQWFEEVGSFVKPKYKDGRNKWGETPIMVFRREHALLRKEGEEWIKKTADSYTITAALIITIVFAAAITVPGGNDGQTGKAIYARKSSFIVFAVADAIALFASTTSLLLFLSILTARYRDEDFLYKLPKRLILGLTMLFLSVSSMMVAFSEVLHLMFGQGREWILVPIATLTCLPIASFVTLQLPLLVDLISSTYGHGIFDKQRDHKKKQS